MTELAGAGAQLTSFLVGALELQDLIGDPHRTLETLRIERPLRGLHQLADSVLDELLAPRSLAVRFRARRRLLVAETLQVVARRLLFRLGLLRFGARLQVGEIDVVREPADPLENEVERLDRVLVRLRVLELVESVGVEALELDDRLLLAHLLTLGFVAAEGRNLTGAVPEDEANLAEEALRFFVARIEPGRLAELLLRLAVAKLVHESTPRLGRGLRRRLTRLIVERHVANQVLALLQQRRAQRVPRRRRLEGRLRVVGHDVGGALARDVTRVGRRTTGDERQRHEQKDK